MNLHLEYAITTRYARDLRKGLPHEALFVWSVPFANAITPPVGTQYCAPCGDAVIDSYPHLHGRVTYSFNIADA